MKNTYYMIRAAGDIEYGGYESLKIALMFFKKDPTAEKIIKVVEERTVMFPVKGKVDE